MVLQVRTFFDYDYDIYILITTTFQLMMTIGLSLQDIAIEKVLQREHRLEEEEESRRIESNGSDDISLWHKWMKWSEIFRGKDTAVRKFSYSLLTILLF